MREGASRESPAREAADAPAEESLLEQIRQLEERRALEAKAERARGQLREARGAGEDMGQKGWFRRRLEGRRQEKAARKDLEQTGERLKELPSGGALERQIGKGLESLGEPERQRLAERLTPAQRELAGRVLGAARRAAQRVAEKAARRAMGLEHERDRGMGL